MITAAGEKDGMVISSVSASMSKGLETEPDQPQGEQ